LALNFEIQNFIWAVKNSLIQGLGTVVVCLIAGFYLALGLLYFSKKNQERIRPLCLVSYVLPSIFTIMISLNSLPLFPYGHLGVIFIFSVMHIGFAAIYVADALEKKLNHLDLVSRVYGISRFSFYQKIVLPTLKNDFLILGSIIFLSCLSSLSVPLLAGGGKGTNLEVYIYEKIFIEQNWSEALILSGIQFFLLFFIGKFIFNKNKDKNKIDMTNRYSLQKLKSKTAAIVLISVLTIYIFGYLYKVIDVFLDTDLFSIFDSEFFSAWINSVIVFAGFFFVSLVMLIFLLYALFKGFKPKALNLFLYPSTILVGFSFYLLAPVSADYQKMIFGLVILFFAGLYQSYISAGQLKIESHILICRIYKIHFSDFLKDIFWKQSKKNILFLASLIYLISISEFALFKASGVQIQTVGTLTELYLNSYRMNQAYVISFFSLGTWCIFYFLLRGIYADYRKS
jgi:thiamine transport system permease protein